MSVDGWNTLLVLGGIRSGKSEFAESLVSGATSLRYLATSASPSEEDPEWQERIAAHRDRRPETWVTEETAADPGRLITTLIEAKPDETLLVDDLGGWVGVLLDPAYQPSDDVKTIEELAAAVRGCAARLVLVSPEVGLSLVPATTLGRAFADALGTVNQAVAAAVDAVVLVVAGQPTWLKGESAAALTGAPTAAPAAAPEAVLADVPAPIVLPEVITPVTAPLAPASTSGAVAAGGVASGGVASGGVASGDVASGDVASGDVASGDVASGGSAGGDALRGPTQALPMVRTGLVIQPNMELPLPDEETGPAALDRLATLDIAGTGLGELADVVRFAAATQGTDTPVPWQSVRVLLVQGDHTGGASAGSPAGEPDRRTAQARLGIGALAQLTAAAGATLQVVDAPAAAPFEDGPALTLAEVDDALRLGWRLAEEAVESGSDLLVIAAGGAGTPAAAAAVLAATAGAEPSAVLPPVRTPEGDFDDNAWMTRCAAVRDAMQRVRKGSREAKDILAEVGGGDVAVVTGILLGATARRTPVLLDGPVGVAAALVSRDLAGQARHWCLLPDHNGDPAVKLAADVLGLTPILNMRLDLGEGTAALAALPLLRSAIALAASIPPRTSPSSTPDDAATAGTSGIVSGPDGNAASGTSGGTSGVVSGTSGNAASGTSGIVSGPDGNAASGTSGGTSGVVSGTSGNAASGTSGIVSGPDGNAASGTSGGTSGVVSGTSGNAAFGTSGVVSGTSWPADGLDATDAAGAAAAGAAGLLAEAALSASSTTSTSTSGDAPTASVADDEAVALASAVGVVTGDPTTDRSGDPAGPATASPATGDSTPSGTTVSDTAAGDTTAGHTTAGHTTAGHTTASDTATGRDGDTTTVITGAGGSDPEATAVIRLPGNVAPADGDGDGDRDSAATASSSESTEDEADRTTVLSVVPPDDNSATTAFRPEPTDDPEATIVIATGTGTGTNRTEDDEDATSWLPGFGNPRRSDDPDSPTAR